MGSGELCKGGEVFVCIIAFWNKPRVSFCVVLVSSFPCCPRVSSCTLGVMGWQHPKVPPVLCASHFAFWC